MSTPEMRNDILPYAPCKDPLSIVAFRFVLSFLVLANFVSFQNVTFWSFLVSNCKMMLRCVPSCTKKFDLKQVQAYLIVHNVHMIHFKTRKEKKHETFCNTLKMRQILPTTEKHSMNLKVMMGTGCMPCISHA